MPGVRAASVCDCGTHCCEGPISTPSVLSCHTEIVSSAICHIIFPANPPLSLLVLPCLHARSFFLFDGFFCLFFSPIYLHKTRRQLKHFHDCNSIEEGRSALSVWITWFKNTTKKFAQILPRQWDGEILSRDFTKPIKQI